MDIEKEYVEADLLNFYDLRDLQLIYDYHIKKWIKKGYLKSTVKNYEKRRIGHSNRNSVIKMIMKVFTEPEIFNKIYNDLDKENKLIFDLIMEKTFASTEELKEKNVIAFKKEGLMGYSNHLKDKFALFRVNIIKGYWSTDEKEGIIFLPPTVDSILPFIAENKPKSFYLDSVDSVQTKYRSDSEEEIIKNIRVYYEYAKMDNFSLSSTGKLLKTTIKRFSNACNINEFYPKKIKKLGDMKARLLTEILFRSNIKDYDYDGNDVEILKKYLDDIFNFRLAQEELNLIEILLPFLKGFHNIENFDVNSSMVINFITDITSELSTDKWTKVDDIFMFIITRRLNLEMIERNIASYNIYFIENGNMFRDRVYPDDNYLYHEMIVKPFISAFYFLLSCFGVVEIAYDEPKNDMFNMKDGYLTIYEGIKAIKPTKLGLYILGVNDKYESNIEIDEGKIIPDENNLILTIEGNNPLKRMIVESIAAKITSNKYKADYNSIFKDIDEISDIKKKIENLEKEILPEKLPKNWQSFFNKILENGNSLQVNDDVLVLKVEDNRELIKILAQEDFFKKNILKAENHHIIVQRKDLNKVIKKLREYGFYNG